MFMNPLEPDPTTAVKVVEDRTVNVTAAVPPMLTAVTSAKFEPVTVMVAPVVADNGVNEATVGGLST